MRLSPWPRNPDLRELQRGPFDVIVVGGGIHGCGVARDAAKRGLKVALFEKGDIGSGTSSASSKLVHGGLRYLEQFRFGLVREALRERAVLLRIAPHLVRPLPFLLPLYDDSPHGRLKLDAGLSIYDFLAGRRRIARHGWVPAHELAEREPSLLAESLRGGFHFADAQMNDARFCLENALDARAHGAQVWNYIRVDRLIESGDRVTGVELQDERDGHRFAVHGHVIVSAIGPWQGRVAGSGGLGALTRVRLSKGSHIVVPSLTKGHALLLTAHGDGRVFFVLPYKGRSLVGTTEIEIEGSPDEVRVTEDEISYLLAELRHAFGERAPSRADVLASFCGVRSISVRDGSAIGDASREAELVEELPGLLSIVGGKYTTYRAVAERCVDRVERLLERAHRQRCRSDLDPLPGGSVADMDGVLELGEETVRENFGVDGATLRYLVGTYGSRHPQLLETIKEDPSFAERLEPEHPFTRGEIVHAVRFEGARTLEDLLWRRSYRAFLGPLADDARRRWEDALRTGLSA